MSLTSKLNGKNEEDINFQTIITKILPNKNQFSTISGKIAFSKDYEMLSPNTLSNPYFASVSGTAFDYVARAIIARETIKYKNVYSGIVAQRGLSYLREAVDKILFLKVENKYNKYIKLYKEYANNKSIDISRIIEVSCFFAHLDHIVRSGMLPMDIKESLIDHGNEEILIDIEKLACVFRQKFIDGGMIKYNSKIIYNPTFGMCSALVGGADADIYIDGTLYDFKTSKSSGYKWHEVAQITAYYLFHCINSRTADILASIDEFSVERVAFYRARTGEIEFFDTGEFDQKLMDEVLEELVIYFHIE